jgi:8-oxo-dGTP pyrophosphatase MutT (NUDIX family)
MEQWPVLRDWSGRVSWRDHIIAALDPARAFAADDERHFHATLDDHRAAAVLIPITNRPEPGVILTQRPDWLRSHAGQIAFPGGKVDDDDADVVAAALREAEEEIGLPRHQVEILGEADTYYTGSGFRITPIVGVIAPDLPLVLNPDEVSDWFEVPLAFLLDPANARIETGTWQGHERQYYDIQWQTRRIWGVTAGIIANLARRVNG